MKTIKLTPQARADLDGIWTYTAETWGIEQAEAYLMGLDSTMKLLATHPKLGRSISDIREGYFKFPAASHLLIFRIAADAIEVVPILHKSSDVERHVGEGS
jgi:toxin ParE1/3/4